MLTKFAWSLICVKIAGQAVDFRIEPVQGSPGVYLQLEGTARLCTSEWEVATYISPQGDSNNVDAIGKYIDCSVPFSTRGI